MLSKLMVMLWKLFYVLKLSFQNNMNIGLNFFSLKILVFNVDLFNFYICFRILDFDYIYVG